MIFYIANLLYEVSSFSVLTINWNSCKVLDS